MFWDWFWPLLTSGYLFGWICTALLIGKANATQNHAADALLGLIWPVLWFIEGIDVLLAQPPADKPAIPRVGERR